VSDECSGVREEKEISRKGAKAQRRKAMSDEQREKSNVVKSSLLDNKSMELYILT
jgi:hypothetical protein